MNSLFLGLILVLQAAAQLRADVFIQGYDDLRVKNAQDAPLKQQNAINGLFNSLSQTPAQIFSFKTLSYSDADAASKLKKSFWIPSNANEHELSKKARIALTGLKKYISKSKIATLSYVKYKYRLPAPICNNSVITCDEKDAAVRRFDGKCNNLDQTWWGSAGTPFKRLLAQEYDDGVTEPRTKSVLANRYLPNARKIAYVVHTPKRTVSEWSAFATYFGQFLDHDLTLTPKSANSDNSLKGCTCGSLDPECFNIPIPFDDKFNYDQRCIPFVRSTPSINQFDCNLGPREQLNRRTHFLDLDHVYGASAEENAKLVLNDGKFNVSVSASGEVLLPFIGNSQCSAKYQQCYLTGDSRAEDNALLTSFHTLYVRAHNLFYVMLNGEDATSECDGDCTKDPLFVKIRNLLIAVQQNIVYGEFLPTLLGDKLAKAYNLLPLQDGFNTIYKNDMYPQIANEFATAAFRYGHTHITHELRMANKYYKLSKPMPIYTYLFNNHYYQNFLPDLIAGTCMEWSYTPTAQVNSYFNNHLFENLPKYDGAKRYSLPALNIQRGRDHGLPGYNKYREMCGLNRARSFADFYNIPIETRARLESLYPHPDDVDLWTGIVSEKNLEGAMIGATGGCIIAKQFRDLKLGDRFYYENELPGGFTVDQLNVIKKITMKYLLCAVFKDKITVVQKYPFFVADKHYNPLLKCEDVLSEVDTLLLTKFGSR